MHSTRTSTWKAQTHIHPLVNVYMISESAFISHATSVLPNVADILLLSMFSKEHLSVCVCVCDVEEREMEIPWIHCNTIICTKVGKSLSVQHKQRTLDYLYL